MSDSDQFDPFFQPRSPFSNQEALEALTLRIPHLKGLLEGPPDQVLTNIQNLSMIPQAERKNIGKAPISSSVKMTKTMVEQLNKVTNWNVDHEQLYSWLKSITEFIPIDLNYIYKNSILGKIQNGLTFIEFLGRVSSSSSLNGPRIYKSGPTQTEINKALENCYKVTKSDVYKEDPDFALYYKRYDCLNNQQKLKYKIKLLRHLIAIPSMANNRQFDPLNPNPLLNYSNRGREEQLVDVEKFYQELETIEYGWFLEELFNIDCPKTTEYKKIIASLGLKEPQGEESEVCLEQPPKIRPNLVTKNVLLKCLEVQSQNESNLLSEGNTLKVKDNLYLKYDITQLVDLSFEHIASTKNITQASAQEAHKKHLSHTIEKLYLLLQQANESKPILVYEDFNTFKSVSAEQLLDVVQFCTKMIALIIEFGKALKRIAMVSEILAKPDLVIYLNMALASIGRNRNEEKCRKIFLRICRIIEDMVLQNQDKIPIMNNKDFLNLFVDNVNRIVSDQELKMLPSKLQSFLISYIPKLFEYGLEIEKLNLDRIYQLELNNLSSSRPSQGRHERMMMMNRLGPPDRDYEAQLRELELKEKNKLENFISVFPGCIPYFNQKLQTSITSIQQQLAGLDIFDSAPSANLQSLLKLFVSEQIPSNENLAVLFKNLLNQHPSLFVKASESVNFAGLKKKLDVKEEDISACLLAMLASLRQGLAVESISPEELCQKTTTSNYSVINLANSISHLNLLLKMRQASPSFSFIKELLEISLMMEKIESICLNKIVKHQAQYSDEKLGEIKKYYSEVGDKKILYYTIQNISKLLFDTCWDIFSGLGIAHLNILLKELRIYFEAMKNLTDKNLLLRLLKKTQRYLARLNIKTQKNLNFQLYNHNKEIIIEVFGLIYKQILSSKVKSHETAVMGNSYLRFIDNCKKKGKDPATQFNVIIIPHIEESVSELMDFIFFRIRRTRNILNNKQYRGLQNTVMVVRSVFYDVFTRISNTFDKDYVKFYKTFITNAVTRGMGSQRVDAEQQIPLEIQEPTDPLRLILKEQKQKIMPQSYIAILDKIYEYRYQKSCLSTLQNIFFILVDQIAEKYKVTGQEQKILKSIIQEISQNSQNMEFDQQLFKMQCSWIDIILSKVKGVRLEDFLSIGFIKKYIKHISLMLNNPEQYKESIPNSIFILQRFLPKNYAEDRSELIAFALSLLQVISKVIGCSIESKKVNARVIESIASILIQSKCSEFDLYIQQFLRVLIKQDVNIGPLLSSLIEKQSKLPLMEADLKGVFLKQSQNLVDESQEKISIRLNTFIDIFKFKYGEDVTTFGNLTNKFVSKSIKNDDKKQSVYLCYDKRNSFCYSQLLKKNFNQFEPSDNIKAIIKDLLEFRSIKNIWTRLDSLRDLLYYSPLMIPYVMLHPVETQNGQLEFIDYLVTEVSSKRVESIYNFLLFACLDHSCMAKLSDRTIFISQYLCYRIIKQIIKVGINKYTLTLTYLLSQLKRFAYLCKIKVDQASKTSFSDVLIKHLAANREGYHYKNCDNNLVYLILAIVFKQDAIDNLKKCFVPKQSKQFEKDYKIINQSLIPFNVFFRNLKNGKIQQREENISFTGNLITPFYPEIYEDVIMDEDYKWIGKSNYSFSISENHQEISEFQADRLEAHHLKSLASVKNTKKYENSERQLITELNESHQVMMYQICQVYFKGENQNDNEEMLQRDGMEQMRQRAFRRRIYRQNLREGRYDRRQRAAERRNRPFVSRYAQEDFYIRQDPQREKKKTLEEQFELSLKAVPSEQAMKEPVSTSNLEDIKTGQEELESLISEINEKLFSLGQNSFNIRELKGQTLAEKKSFLELKNIQLDFDVHKKYLQPHEFERYYMANQHKFQRLDSERKQSAWIALDKIYLRNLDSSDSISQITDAIDENYRHLNIKKTLSRKQSLSSVGDNYEDEQEDFFLSQNNEVPIRAFSDIQEATLYEMLLSFYYVCQRFSSKSFMPFLQNKKSQSKLISTLLHLMKDPFSSEHFPKCIYRIPINELSWKEIPITPANFKQEREKFIERVLAVFQSVKNYSFHQDDKFLLTQISNEGLFDIKYEPIAQSIGENIYVPIFQILQYGFSGQAKSIAINLLRGVKQLSGSKMDQIIELLQKTDVPPETDDQDHPFMMRRFFARRGSNFPYQNFKELFKNQLFQTKFRKIYIFGTKDPTPAFLSNLIQSGIYTNDELKTFQLKFLTSGQEDIQTLIFLNKVTQVYTDEELKDAKWIKDYRQTIARIIDFLNNTSSVQLEKQPISRIFKLTNDLGFEIKRAVFQKKMNESKRNLNFDYYQIERNQVLAKRKKGIFESAFQELKNKPDNFWLSPFSIKFISESGLRESGIGDGVKREWFTLLSKAMVNLNYALFKRTPQNYYFFYRESSFNPRDLQYFEFIGKLFGFSLTKNSLFVSPSFSIMLYKLILGEEITFDDIIEGFGVPPQVKSMTKLKMQIKTKEEFEESEIQIPFVYEDIKLFSTEKYFLKIEQEYLVNKSGQKKKIKLQKVSSKVIQELQNEQQQKILPKTVVPIKVNETIELKPGGSEIFVTFDTLQEFIDLTKKKIIEIEIESIRKQFNAFMSGFKRIVNPKLIAGFTAKELKLLVEGVNTICIKDLKKYTKSDVDQATAQLLWSTLEGLSAEDRGLFLWNWTGVDKMPVEGAKIMGLRMYSTRGPYFISHTCSKQLEVPNCKTKQEMETAVTIIINNVKSGNAIIEDN